MNFRNNKGFTGIDISVAVIVILIFIPTVFGIVYNMQKTRVKTERQVEAVDVATNILEIAKITPYNENYNTTLNANITQKGYTATSKLETDVENGEQNFNYLYYSYTGKNDIHFRTQVEIQKYIPQGQDQSAPDLVKIVKVTVTYPIGNEFKTIDISTLIQNKNI